MKFSQDFLEKLILLIVTAALTGFLIPYILKRVEERKAQEQKEIDATKLLQQKQFEADLSRQSKVIEAQVLLLETLAKQVWEFHLLALAVSYYKTTGADTKFSQALSDYDQKAWNYFASIRTEISKARRLTSEATQQELISLNKNFIEMDGQLMQLVQTNASKEEWKTFHDDLQGSGDKTDKIIHRLADELQLSSVPKG